MRTCAHARARTLDAHARALDAGTRLAHAHRYTAAAELGCTQAMTNLGVMQLCTEPLMACAIGAAPPPLARAAELRDPLACYNLGARRGGNSERRTHP